MLNKDVVTIVKEEVQSVKDICISAQDQQMSLIKDLRSEVLECKKFISENDAILEKIQNSEKDLQIRIIDIQDMLHDIQVRVHDIQDRVYDILSINRTISETQKNTPDVSDKIIDVEARTHDVQDRVYDTLWSLKTQAAQINFLFWRLYKNSNESLDESKYRFFREIPPATGDDRKTQVVLSTLLRTVHEICVENDLAYWLDFGSLLGAVRHNGYIPWDDDIDLGMMRKDMDSLEKILKKDPRFHVRNVYLNRQDGNGILRLFQVRWADTDLGSLKLYMDIFVYDYCQRGGSSKDWQWYMKEKDKLVRSSLQLPKDVSEEGNREKQKILEQKFETAKQKVNDYFGVKYEKSDYILWGFENVNYKIGCDEHLLTYNTIFPLKKLEFEGQECYVPNHYLEYISSIYEDIFSLPADMLTHNHFKRDPERIERLNHLYEMYCK